jgi:gliding motility-associated-like protein
MGKLLIIVFFLFATLFDSNAQCPCFTNPSFEGPTGTGVSPTSFSACANTPDTQPILGNPLLFPPPTNGSAFMGLIAPNTTLGEEAGVPLCSNLVPNTQYNFTIDLAKSVSVSFPNINQNPTLQIWGGTSICNKAALLYTSPAVTTTTFQTYCVAFTPTVAYSHLIFKVLAPSTATFVTPTTQFAYIGIDNIQCSTTTINATATQTNPTCSSTSNGAIAITTGNSNNTYTWQPSVSTSSIATGLGVGIYTVSIGSPTTACSSNTTQVITLTLTAPSASATTSSATATQTNPTCNTATNGIISVNAGSGSFTYSWQPSVSTTSIASGLSIGIYTVNVANSTGSSCATGTAQVTVTLTAPSPTLSSFNAISTQTNPSCTTATNGIISINAGSGSFTYSWLPNISSTSSASNLGIGIYTITVANSPTVACSTGTTQVLTVTLTAPPPSTLNVTATSTQTNPSCNTNNGNINVVVTSGSGNYSYNWLPNVSTTNTANNLSSGNYTVVVNQTPSLCVVSNPTILNIALVPPQGFVASANTTSVLCFGGSNGQINAVANPAGSYTYQWSNGGNSSSISNLSSGTYSVIITAANNCSTSLTGLVVSQPNNLIITSTLTSAICTSSTGAVSVNVTGGTGAFTYLWLPLNSTTQNIVNVPAGNYTLNVIDGNNCLAQNNIIIPSSNSVITVNYDIRNETCSKANGGFTITPSGGNNPFNYMYDSSFSMAGYTTSNVFVNLSANIYSIVVVDANGCIGTTTLTILNENSINSIITKTDEYCGLANGSATATPITGNAPFTYSWSNGNTSQNATNLGSGTYSVIVADKYGCLSNNTFEIFSDKSLTVNALTFPSRCNNPNGSIEAFGFSGYEPYSYQWLNTNGSGNANSNLLNDINAGSYTVVVTDALGCQTSKTFVINNVTDISNAEIIGKNEIEQDMSYSYSLNIPSGWSFQNWIDNDNSLSFNPLLNVMVPFPYSGNYYLGINVLSDFGCKETIYKEIKINTDWNIYVPNAFTPNGDGVNDIFQPKGYGIKKYELQIFNRWGQQIYTTTTFENGWDGSFKGTEESTFKFDVYTWKINVINVFSKKFELTGSVTLMK